MTIYVTSVRISIVGPRSMSLIFRINFVMALALFYELILIKFYTNVKHDNIWDKLAFQHCKSMIKVTIAWREHSFPFVIV